MSLDQLYLISSHLWIGSIVRWHPNMFVAGFRGERPKMYGWFSNFFGTRSSKESTRFWCRSTSWSMQIQSNHAGRVPRVACQYFSFRKCVSLIVVYNDDYWHLTSHEFLFLEIGHSLSTGWFFWWWCQSSLSLEYIALIFQFPIFGTKLPVTKKRSGNDRPWFQIYGELEDEG